MHKHEKLPRELVKEKMGVDEDTLSLYEHELAIYEHELAINSGPILNEAEEFNNEELESLEIFHKLRESGLNYNQINLLATCFDALKDTKIDLRDFFKISPSNHSKKSLQIAKLELSSMETKIQELEFQLEEALEIKKQFVQLETELDAKQRLVNKMDRELQEALMEKGRLKARLDSIRNEGPDSYHYRAEDNNELYQSLTHKDSEIMENKRRNQELMEKLNQKELTVKFMEEKIRHIEDDIEDRYKEQISSLQGQIEGLVEKKQKEWDKFYAQLCKQHKTELTTLQQRHKQQVSNLELKIEVLKESGSFKNPILSLFKSVTHRNGTDLD